MFAMWRAGGRGRQCAIGVVGLLVAISAAPGWVAQAAPLSLQSYYAQAPVWGSCESVIGDTTDLPTARCTTVTVPVDYANLQGPQAKLAVIKIPASGRRLGALLVNPGGPGASAVNTVAGMGAVLADTEIGQSFDLVGFDPRGVGHSTPGLRCRSDAEFDANRRDPMVDYSPAGIAHIEAVSRRTAQDCLQQMGSSFLANVGTASAARDMDVVRAALGESQINYLGFSYGTQLGAAYAESFPDRVRAMVLDGAVDPAADPVTENLLQLAGFQTAFNDYAADCAQSAGCPLGTDPTQFVARYQQLVNPLVLRLGLTSDPRGLSYSDATTGTVNALYTKKYWKFLTSGLLGLQRGTDAGDLLLLADDYQHRDQKGHYAPLQDAFTAIRCVDAPFPTDTATWAAADLKARQLAPFMSYGQYTGYAPRDVCAMWPVPATSRPHQVTSPGPGKVVVVSTTHDPATPYQAGVNLAQEMGASLISFEGTQHTVVFNGDRCVDTAVVAFLTQSVLPAPGLRC
ncbi:alpha/beta hydrolase [Mycobacterium sp. CBMA 213]|uniref:alpha/beta hydrolase n=1 Tax=unclassified Mycolicibacterium TaxID=2636767 RepID=UPI0035CCCB04|nr:alpha/beta hydrolase [Mycolicibacterium sp. CBMA 213]